MSIDSNGRSHAPAGVHDGGQFAAEQRTEPEVSLETSQPGYEAIAEHAMAQVNRRRAAYVGDPFDTAGFQLRALSAMVKDAYPDAVAFRVECSDQAGSDNDMHVLEVLDAHGNQIGAEDYLPLEGKWEDGAFDMGYDLWTHLDGQPGAREMMRDGTATVDIQAVFDGTDPATVKPDGPAPGSVAAAAARGSDVLDKYEVLHDGDVDDVTAVRDMLTDLHHWARANGVDLGERFAAAARRADDEEADSRR